MPPLTHPSINPHTHPSIKPSTIYPLNYTFIHLPLHLFIHPPTHPSTKPHIHLSTHQPIIHSSVHIPPTNSSPTHSICSPTYLHNHQIEKDPSLSHSFLGTHIRVTPCCSTLTCTPYQGLMHHLLHFFYCLFTPALGGCRDRELPVKVHILLAFLNIELEGIPWAPLWLVSATRLSSS